MITDKERAELKELKNQIRKSNQPMQWFDYGWDDCAEIIMRYVEKKNAESAEQARKEAAERAVAFLKKEWYWFNDDACYADELRAAILGDSVVKENLITDHIPDTGKKLAIAVKALEYVASKSLPSSVFESHYSRLQDACAKASDALKEMQG